MEKTSYGKDIPLWTRRLKIKMMILPQMVNQIPIKTPDIFFKK